MPVNLAPNVLRFKKNKIKDKQNILRRCLSQRKERTYLNGYAVPKFLGAPKDFQDGVIDGIKESLPFSCLMTVRVSQDADLQPWPFLKTWRLISSIVFVFVRREKLTSFIAVYPRITFCNKEN